MEPTEPIVPAQNSDGGNGLPPAPSPAQEPAQAPAVPTEPAPTAEPTAELLELPDGRKVDGAGVLQEYKNLLSDYTKKSQAVASLPKSPNTLPTEPSVDPFKDPAYVPQSFAEVIEAARKATLAEIEGKQQAEIEQRQAVENEVSNQLTEIKTADPTVNENALFVHAVKYGFRDLRLAHQNMKDMNVMVKNVQKQTETNIQKRNNEPVSTQPGNSGGTTPNPSQFSSSIDYLRSLNK